MGSTVPYLPEEAKKKTVGGQKYFVFDGTWYQAFVSGDDTIYMVVNEPKNA